MDNARQDPEIHIPMEEPVSELRRTNHEAFQGEIEALAREAENMRLKYMRARQTRRFFMLTIGILSLLAGATAFGWYFLVEGDLIKALMYVGLSITPGILLRLWSNGPLKAYARNHKKVFMPKMAKALGGFSYRRDGGISSKALSASGVVPQHDTYNAEDCFIGTYKKIKVIFSEAHLYQGAKPVFRGLFVLLEIPDAILEGHTIITADKKMAQEWGQTRWKKLTPLAITTQNPDWNRFMVFSDKPEDAKLLVGEKLFKELSEAADIFGKSPLTAVLFKHKFIFLMIPSEKDMFEASDMDQPIPLHGHMNERRNEVEKLLEVIDVFEIYKPRNSV